MMTAIIPINRFTPTISVGDVQDAITVLLVAFVQDAGLPSSTPADLAIVARERVQLAAALDDFCRTLGLPPPRVVQQALG